MNFLDQLKPCVEAEIYACESNFLLFVFFSCSIEVWEQCHEYQAIQLFSSSILASKFHGCFHLVPAFCWGKRCVVESWDVLLFFFFFSYILKKFFTMLHWFLLQQCRSAIIRHTSPPFLASLLSLIPSLQVITGHQTGLCLLLSNFSPAIHLTPGSVCMLMLHKKIWEGRRTLVALLPRNIQKEKPFGLTSKTHKLHHRSSALKVCHCTCY